MAAPPWPTLADITGIISATRSSCKSHHLASHTSCMCTPHNPCIITASSTTILFHLLRAGLIPILLDIVLLTDVLFRSRHPGFVPISCLLLRPPERTNPLAFNLRPLARLGIPVHPCPRTRTRVRVATCYDPVVRPRCEYIDNALRVPASHCHRIHPFTVYACTCIVDR